MAANFTANPGSGGDTFRADDLTTYKIPGSKLVLGAVGADDGFVSSTNPLPITGSVTVSGTIAFSNTSLAVTQSGSWVLAANSGVDIGDVTVNNASGASAVNIQDGGNSITVDGTVSATQGTSPWVVSLGTNAIPTGSNVIGVVTAQGAVGQGGSVAGNPLPNGYAAYSTDPAAVTSGKVARGIATLLGKQVVMPYAQPGATWSYAAAAAGLVSTTGVTAKAAAGAGIRNYIVSVDVVNSNATTGTDVQIRDGAAGTVLWRGYAAANGGGVSRKFDPPLRGTANTLVEIAEGTATATNGVYVNLCGFTAGE